MKTNIYNDFVTQASQHAKIMWTSSNGFCLNAQKEICIVWEEEKGEWNLPGGGREEGENPEQTFIREVEEESQCTPTNIQFIHSVYSKTLTDEGAEIITEKDGRCFRFICDLVDIEDFVPRKNGTEIDERKFVAFEELPTYISWLADSENGRESYEVLRKYIQRI